ncbi:multidrug ABC transporter permease [Virgibacillus pantothenticus]|uniref:Multidrug ABC transporter permease n=1 Tax=Virgibacillus pantothenticus TaxID=1473 RepID=A0A0L0QTK1_VIRPA|nr:MULTISPECIES: ABC transporter ATP-binding protein [Virgibacillus]API91123.1 multidrug ABC transporter permease [Virgibacillus sp. 6R]KNE21924.1 multidrug ABC transporter permease [Virgibacillus pantothenticus]MBS7429112.1 ABC transporter ATP-binding protein [Virgibacillus sp. 19R1-5]MBU8566860.1 ABC transporter ATP-binding protein/permease [Virgibacillus pantothenticus]MBU8600447.1 ABC transporter ATP-binding protein/permease [Virgibacillus pantothenticus]
MSTEKRLVAYAFPFKKQILIGLLCLIIAVALELAGPLIAKKVIDEHVLGIEGTWDHVTERDDRYTVTYQNKYYKRSDRIGGNDDVIGETITILAVGSSYYMINDKVPLKGEREIQDGLLTVKTVQEQWQFTADKLSISEIYPFFKPEQMPILYLLGLYVGLLIIAGFFQFYQTFLLQKASNQIVKKMRNDLFAHTQRIPINYFVDQPAGKIVARITNDTEAIRDLYERVLSIIVTSVIYMAGIFIALFILDAQLALWCLLLIPLIWGWMKLYKHFGTKYNQVIRSTISEINGNINEAIQGMPIIQAFQREKKTKQDFETLNHRHFIYQRKLVKLSALTSYNLVTVFRNIAFVGFIWYFGSASLEPTSAISIGLLYAFTDYLTRLFEPVTDIVNQLPLIEQARVAGSRVFTLLDHKGEDVVDEKIARYRGHIQFDRVSFAYNEGDDVLRNLSFEIKPGETAAFVGHTGSGKSSIMNVLFRFYDPQQGTITIDGYSTREWSRQQTRSHMGIVLQDPFLFSGTILSNVTMNDPNISIDKAKQALKAVGADSFIEKLPNQYNEEVGEGGTTFSLGERQLISFARALAFDPAILILDEATANIDTETETIIQKALEVLKIGRTTLVIAHRLSTIQQADTIFVLDHGTIKEMGNHNTLMQAKGSYYQMYQMQQSNKSAV